MIFKDLDVELNATSHSVKQDNLPTYVFRLMMDQN